MLLVYNLHIIENPHPNCNYNNDFTLNDYELQALREVVDPLQECDDYGVELYLIAREFVYEAVRMFQ